MTTSWQSHAARTSAPSSELSAKHVTRAVSLSDPAIGRVLGAVATDITRRAPCDVLVANTTTDPTS